MYARTSVNDLCLTSSPRRSTRRIRRHSTDVARFDHGPHTPMNVTEYNGWGPRYVVAVPLHPHPLRPPTACSLAPRQSACLQLLRLHACTYSLTRSCACPPAHPCLHVAPQCPTCTPALTLTRTHADQHIRTQTNTPAQGRTRAVAPSLVRSPTLPVYSPIGCTCAHLTTPRPPSLPAY